MMTQQETVRQTGRSLPGEIPPLPGRDIDLIVEPGTDAGIVRRVPATRLFALRGRMKIVQRERFHRGAWFGVIVLFISGSAVVLGFQLF